MGQEENGNRGGILQISNQIHSAVLLMEIEEERR
jgi:hypothetical protein